MRGRERVLVAADLSSTGGRRVAEKKNPASAECKILICCLSLKNTYPSTYSVLTGRLRRRRWVSAVLAALTWKGKFGRLNLASTRRPLPHHEPRSPLKIYYFMPFPSFKMRILKNLFLVHLYILIRTFLEIFK